MKSLNSVLPVWLGAGLVFFFAGSLSAQETFIPRKQTKLPGPPLSPAEAIKKMTVPEGFSVELVVSEPDLVNPVAMTFDEQGRVWVTESLEYPRSSPGQGRDRVKVLEDTDSDGTIDKTTIFADGLNIPSGIAVGFGGVWVANAPDILFLEDTDGDLKADRREVVVTGFGRADTHELPNSLTWGPDGFLYGLNGVFNHSHVKYPPSSPHAKDHPEGFPFTCALFRINPRTREFQVFAEGTSNPWGIAWDPEGSAFLSACVIDHLWHITESGYYHRQGGPYPPFTWKLGSIVKHQHQMAAYCGIHYFDSDAYPKEYRDHLYMGNIHGGCINVDTLRRDGSTYFATPRPDFLTANDVWFMPVAQKTGPDGCLWVLDWYDRYHCYQDARRDPKGLDRLHGRLYRIRYKNTPRAKKFNLAKETDDELIERLKSPNVFYRDIAQRLLAERNHPAANAKLEELVLDSEVPHKTCMHALFAIVGTQSLRPEFHSQLLSHKSPSLRAWGVRAAGNFGKVKPLIAAGVAALSDDPSPDVKLQVAIAAPKLDAVETIPTLLAVLSNAGNDPVIPHIVWQNLHPLLETNSRPFLEAILKEQLLQKPAVVRILPRVVDRILAIKKTGAESVGLLLTALLKDPKSNRDAAQTCLKLLAERVQTRELAGDELKVLQSRLDPQLAEIVKFGIPEDNPLFFDALGLAASWKEPRAIAACRVLLANRKLAPQHRLQALQALVSAKDEHVLSDVQPILMDSKNQPLELRESALAELGRVSSDQVAVVVLSAYPRMENDLQPKAVELLTQRPGWSKSLLAAIGTKKLPASVLNINQVRKLLAQNDAELAKAVREHWGVVRVGRDPAREQFVAKMKNLIQTTPGDAIRGRVAFNKLCAQCHKIYGEGKEVGPDITSNGRASFDQLLSNVFDPSLVIGSDYRPLTVATEEGRVLAGLVVENSEQRIVLKVQGGKLETIPRNEVAAVKQSQVSLMPEGIEKQLKPQEIVDLFAFLLLDKPPEDPKAQLLPGAPVVEENTSRAKAQVRNKVCHWLCQGCGNR